MRAAWVRIMTPQVQGDAAREATTRRIRRCCGQQEGEAMWSRADGTDSKSCAVYRGDAATSMRGVAARYPGLRYCDNARRRQRIQMCRVNHQHSAPFKAESQEQLDIEVSWRFTAWNADRPTLDPRLQAARPWCELLFKQHIGQLDFSCAQCHDDNAGHVSRAAPFRRRIRPAIPCTGSSGRAWAAAADSVRGCMTGVRAEPFAYGAQELIDLNRFSRNAQPACGSMHLQFDLNAA